MTRQSAAAFAMYCRGGFCCDFGRKRAQRVAVQSDSWTGTDRGCCLGRPVSALAFDSGTAIWPGWY